MKNHLLRFFVVRAFLFLNASNLGAMDLPSAIPSIGSKEVVIVRKTIQPFPDGVFEYYKNDKKIGTEKYKNNKPVGKIFKIPDGLVREYYDDGKLMQEDQYKNGKQNSYSRSYSENGNILVETNFVNGYFEGLEKEYYPDGKLMEECMFKNGILVKGSKKSYPYSN